MLNFNQKETSLLKDQQKHEELCIKKYGNYANQAQDPQLKQIFTSNGQQEQQHLNTINTLLSGQLPNVSAQGGASQSQFPPITPNTQAGLSNQSDAVLCEDLLSAEKYVSSTYNTAIFEFRDVNVRNLLNHIQKEEQEHGEKISSYMISNGMYS